MAERLTEAQEAEALRLWSEGESLGRIAEAVGCGLYAISRLVFVVDCSMPDAPRADTPNPNEEPNA